MTERSNALNDSRPTIATLARTARPRRSHGLENLLVRDRRRLVHHFLDREIELPVVAQRFLEPGMSHCSSMLPAGTYWRTTSVITPRASPKWSR
jgi:hypothetical protein